MKSLTSAARLCVLALCVSGTLTACKKADAPAFSPGPGTYTNTQYVAMSSPTLGSIVVYTTDGSAPSCANEHGTIYSAPVAITRDTTLKAMACALLRDESPIVTGKYIIKPPEPAAAPVFSPAAGLYFETQQVSISSATAEAAIRYTSDGSAPTCSSGTAYAAPLEVAQDTTLNAIACASGRPDSTVSSAAYVIRTPAAAPVFDPAPGAYTGVQHITLSSATPGATFKYSTDGQSPVCGGNTAYNGPIEISNSLTLKAVACAANHSDSPVTSGGYDITIPPPESVWKAVDFNNGANLAAGTHSTNEAGDALNLSGRGKVESGQQVFHYVYTKIRGDFVMTARLDGVDFAGLVSNQGRAALLLTPDITATANNFIYGSAMFNGSTTPFGRSHRLAAPGNNSNNSAAVPGSGTRYLKLTRTGDVYQAAGSMDGGASYVLFTGNSGQTFAAALPEELFVGFMISSSSNTVAASATFSDVQIRGPAGNLLVAPNSFTGEIGAPTEGGGTPPPPTGPTHPEDLSRGDTAQEPAPAPDVLRYNLEGYAAAATTGGGNIPESDARYRKVTTATELVAALRDAKASSANPVKVIEIVNDLNMGYNEVGTLLTSQASNPLRPNLPATKHPKLIASGVTLLDIQDFSGLTIYSKNGSTIRHAEFNIKGGTNLILRNLRFDELWEWDEATRGAYDANDWDFVTIGDGGGVTSGIWVDHCTFTKSYDGVLDIKKGASNITISWSAVLPASTEPGSFVRQQFDALEANRTNNVMYNLLRSNDVFTQEQIIAIALPQKKGHLIGSTDLERLSSYTVTLHHNYYKDLQDRMPRLRGGDVHAWNLYVDSSNARIVKAMRDEIVAASPTLATQLSSTYSFGITSQASISTEDGAVQVEDSVFWGVLTPFRNNQTDVNNPAYTGAIRGSNLLHILLATDTQFMPVTSQQSTFTDRGFVWASWQGNSDSPGSTLGPTQAPQIPFVWHNGGGPTYLYTKDPVASLGTLLAGPQGAGAGRIGMSTGQWLSVTN